MINSAIDTNSFPDTAKQASFTPIDKGGNDKHIYIPVSVLNTLSKIIELAIFDQLFINFCFSLSQNVRRTERAYKIVGGTAGTG